MRLVCEKKEAGMDIGKTNEGGYQLHARLLHVYRQKEAAAKRTVNTATKDMEADVCNKLDEDSEKKMIYKMARDMD